MHEEAAPAVRGFATFVSVDAEGKPYPHGPSLPLEWVEAHRILCEDAERLPKS